MFTSIILLLISLVIICLGYKKHYKQVFKKEINPKVQNIILSFGYTSLIISMIVSIKLLGTSLGLSFWLFALCPVIIIIAFVLTYKDKLVKK